MAQLDVLKGRAAGGVLTIDGAHRLTVKHPAKVLWPEVGLTTVDVMRYYVRVAPFMLPHIKDRPLSFRRFSQGIHGPSQFHQRIKWPTPPGVRTASFPAQARQFETRLIAGDLTTLLYCVNLAIISQDVWLSRLEDPDRPDYAVFDLDPSPALPFGKVVAARAARATWRAARRQNERRERSSHLCSCHECGLQLNAHVRDAIRVQGGRSISSFSDRHADDPTPGQPGLSRPGSEHEGQDHVGAIQRSP